ncbi:hypothetical protein K505DRAFT_291046, partial [Melanomma pulvis-pyrius CBS 109.77]
MAPAAAGEQARPMRMPRLMYRNPLPADQTSLSSAHTSSSDTPSIEAAADQRLSTPSSTATSSPVHPKFDSRALSKTTTSASLASDASSSKDSKAPKKKKANGVLGFLSLKEPSHSALEQFAEQQRKLASEKGAVGNSIALGTVSPQKLPANIPKVNSKWDGVPESQRKSKDRDSLQRKRKSTASQATSKFSITPTGSSLRNGSVLSTSSDGSSRNPPNSIVSTANSSSHELSDFSLNQSTLGPRRDSGPSITSPEKSHSSMNSPSTTSLPEISYFFPDNPNPSGALSPSSPDSTPRGQQLITDVDDLVNTEVIFRRLSRNQAFLAGEAQEMVVPESHSFLLDNVEAPQVEDQSSDVDSYDDDDFTLPSPNSDGPMRSPTMNFSRPLSVQSGPLAPKPIHLPTIIPPSRRTPSGLPTLYEVSIASSHDVSADVLDSDEPRKSMDAASIATSVTPSVMSGSWYQSSRERLGLGGRIRKTDITPWESQ